MTKLSDIHIPTKAEQEADVARYLAERPDALERIAHIEATGLIRDSEDLAAWICGQMPVESDWSELYDAADDFGGE